MNVLVLTSTFPRWKNDTEPNFVYELSNRLSKSFNVTVLSPHYQKSTTAEKMGGINVFRFRYFFTKLEKLSYEGGILSNLKKNPFLLLIVPFFLGSQVIAIRKLVRAHNITLIHAHWIIPQGLCAIISKKLFKLDCKILLTSHGGDLYSINSFLLRFLKKWTIANSNCLAVVSNAMKHEAEKLNCSQIPIKVCPMGVDLQKTFIPSASNKNRKGLIFVGRLVEKKGVTHLLDAFKLVLKTFPSQHLTIIGDGPLTLKLKDQAKKLAISSNTTFLGSVENRLIPQYLQNNEITIIPSVKTADGDQEGLGLTIIEAMGCECAVVASSLPAIADIIRDNVNGVYSKPQDYIDISEKILDLLSNTVKKERIAKQGRSDCLKYFDWSVSTDKYLLIYDELNGYKQAP